MEPQMNQNGQTPIPNSTAVLVLGILSIVGCFCYGVVGLILGIIALVLANKGKQVYSANPSNYTQGSLKNLNGGRTCAIIGISLSALYLVMILFIVGSVGWGALMEAAQGGNPQDIIDAMKDR